MTDRPYVNHVESNLKGGVHADLGQRTLLLGPNGSGKSAILNAIELAGTGRVSDVAGRATLAKESELLTLAPVNEDLYARIVFSEGGEAEYRAARGKRAKRTGREVILPLRDVWNAILGSPETGRKWLLGQLPPIDWHNQVRSFLPAALLPLSESVSSLGLVGALEAARKRSREALAEAKAQRSILSPSAPPPTDESIAELERVIQTWMSQESRNRGRATRERLEADLVQSQALVMSLKSQSQALEAELRGLPSAGADLEVHQAAVLVCEAMAKAALDRCLLCDGKVQPKDIATRAQRGRARIEELSRKAKRAADLGFALREVHASLAIAQREGARIHRAVDEARAAASLDEAPLPDLDAGTAQVQLRSQLTLRAEWATRRKAEERAVEFEQTAQQWSLLAAALSQAMGVLVDSARTAFEQKVQGFLPPSDAFGLDLLEGDREVLRVGLRRGACLHSALSGAEWARVCAAMAHATSPCEGCVVVAPQEAAFDPDTLQAFLSALGSGSDRDLFAPQIIVSSPIAPVVIPEGWTVVWVGGVRYEAGKRTKAGPKGGKVDPKALWPEGKVSSNLFD